MITTVTTKNMVTIPIKLARKMGITPGCRLQWLPPAEGEDEIRVRIVPPRVELARRLLGAAQKWSPDQQAVRELLEQRQQENPGGGA